MSGPTLIVVPALRRPHRVGPLIASLAAATPEPHRVLFVGTAGDTEELEAIRAAGVDLEVILPNRRGDYACKINHAYRISSEPFLFLGADDVHFHPGWLSAALDAMGDKCVGVVGTQDLGNSRVQSGSHATHFLVRREYVDAHGTIDERDKVLHEGYPHEFVDDELIATAKKRGAWAFAEGSVVEHLHPLWGKAPTDPIYDQHAERMRAGRKVFARRRRLWK